MGWLHPNIGLLTAKLDRAKFPLRYCKPLVNPLQEGIKNHFGLMSQDPELVAAAILLPKFKCTWSTDDVTIRMRLCFAVSQTGEERLKQVTGEFITFPIPRKEGGTLVYNTKNIAVVVKGNMDIYQDSFKDRIHWDQETGLFTIRDLKTNDSGIYKVDGRNGIHSSYQLTVYEPVSSPILTSAGNESCSVECSVKNDRDVTLSWYRGEEILNRTSSSNLSINLFLPLDEEVKDRDIYRCEAANPVTKENLTFQFPQFCKGTDFDSERTRQLGIFALICILIAIIGLVAIYLKTRQREIKDPSNQDVSLYAEVNCSRSRNNQEVQSSILELDRLSKNTERKTVYDQLQLRHMSSGVINIA
ncbi:hypothetical protein UPYG_G00041930 [Umbra pygmaea]|uniref:Ig-like domain-containing protein n=1 Tax=Umbra pygmaea TaxID=75934 RepID=A0ABD0XSH8_UMBPY